MSSRARVKAYVIREIEYLLRYPFPQLEENLKFFIQLMKRLETKDNSFIKKTKISELIQKMQELEVSDKIQKDFLNSL